MMAALIYLTAAARRCRLTSATFYLGIVFANERIYIFLLLERSSLKLQRLVIDDHQPGESIHQ